MSGSDFMKIAIAGIGYVGLANGILLAQHHEVYAYDIVQEKVDQLNQGQSPIADRDIEEYLHSGRISFRATINEAEAFCDAEYIIIATPTDYDTRRNFFDTSSIEDVLGKIIRLNPTANIVIKSTVPVGYTKSLQRYYQMENTFFAPEFLREGKALYDNLHPSRIIMGAKTKAAKKFADILVEAAIEKDVPVLFMDSTEAEAVKLFANTYLALRVAYFNELDSYAELRGLDSAQIIKGVCLDPRIGQEYNNPSFGYGGYCLPKDTKQLLANYKDIPQNLITAIVQANHTRKDHITDMILMRDPQTVGIYRLTMKTGSDNFRASAIQGIIKRLHAEGKKILVYEPAAQQTEVFHAPVTDDLSAFKEKSDVIVANRWSLDLADVKDKVYTRDIFQRD